MGLPMSDLDEPAVVLSIGFNVGGKTAANSGWAIALRQLSRDISVSRAGVDSDLNVNIEFHIPGNLLAPDFEGVRSGFFREKDSLLKVQVALPPVAPDDPRSMLLEYLFAALDEVDKWAIAKSRSADTRALREIVMSVADDDRKADDA